MATNRNQLEPDWMFRQLSSQEEGDFRQWARNNWGFDKKCDPAWHPVVREEWAKITRENGGWFCNACGHGPNYREDKWCVNCKTKHQEINEDDR